MQSSQVDYTLFFRTLSQNLLLDDNKIKDMFYDQDNFGNWYINYMQHFKKLSLSLKEQQKKMLRSNPKYILRNYMAQVAIEKSEHEQDYSEIDKLMTLLQYPFDEPPQMQHYAGLPPDWASTLSISCSS